MNQADLRQMAEERIKNANTLIRGKRWEFAYYVAGYSIECALKSCVLARMIHTGLVFQDDWKSKDCRVHDFGTLIDRAGLTNELKARQAASLAAGDSFVSNWGTLLGWKPESRYAIRSEAEARALFAAITQKPDGVLQWLKKYW